jgi:hypothetical protein
LGVPNALVVLVFPNALVLPPNTDVLGFPKKGVVAGVVEEAPAAPVPWVLAAAEKLANRFPLVVVEDPLGFPNKLFLSVIGRGRAFVVWF